MYTEALHEKVALLAKLNPASVSGQTVTSWVSVQNYHRFAVLVHVGAVANDSLVNVQVEQALGVQGYGQKILTSKVVETLDTSDDNAFVWIDVQSEELDAANGYSAINLKVTTQGTAVILVGYILGYEPRFKPVPTTLISQLVD